MAVERHRRGDTSGRRLVGSYDRRFLATMVVSEEQIDDVGAIVATFADLDPFARDLADLLLLAVGAGEPVPERFVEMIDEDGEPLWCNGLLLPRQAPSMGATIDPRYYSAACRVNPALTSHAPLQQLAREVSGSPQPPPSDVLWDAVVVASRLEGNPARTTKTGELRRDDLRYHISRLGEDEVRWKLAVDFALATGLVRSAAGRLYGIPESKPRPVTAPERLLREGGPRRAAELLLRVVRDEWIPLGTLEEELKARFPTVFSSEESAGSWERREGAWLREAGDLLHRVGVFDAVQDPEHGLSWRRAGRRPERPPGFMLTPDRDILIAPGELPPWEYGRLCRLAPYVSGDVVHRHQLTRDGVAADLACGYDDVLNWLGVRSRTGVAGNVRASVEAWIREAARVTLFSEVSVLETADGALALLEERPPEAARVIDYQGLPPARFEVRKGIVHVPYGEDALTVRSVVDRIGRSLSPDEDSHRWELAPSGVDEPDRLLDELRRYHDGELPGELEAAVHAAGGRVRCWVEEAVILHLPNEAYDALRRDRVAGPLVARELVRGQVVVDRRDLDRVRSRLDELGYQLEDET